MGNGAVGKGVKEMGGRGRASWEKGGLHAAQCAQSAQGAAQGSPTLLLMRGVGFRNRRHLERSLTGDWRERIPISLEQC